MAFTIERPLEIEVIADRCPLQPLTVDFLLQVDVGSQLNDLPIEIITFRQPRYLCQLFGSRDDDGVVGTALAVDAERRVAALSYIQIY